MRRSLRSQGALPLATLSRRELLTAAGASLAVAACAPAAPGAPAAPRATAAATLPLPETTTVRLAGAGGRAEPPTCDAPLWLIEDLLREEGFTDVRFGGLLCRGTADFTTVYANFQVTGIDAGFPLLMLAGGHTGCIELWAAPGISSVRDLRAKTYLATDRVASCGEPQAAGITYGFLLSTLAHIGIDPAELKVVDLPQGRNDVAEYLDGRSDVIVQVVHQGALMRRDPRRRGSVILDSAVDKPWSQNYCCMLATHRDFAKANPVATKRVTRAFLRASDMVAADKKAAVRIAVDKGFYKANASITPEILLETISMLSYDWRDFEPEETLRFFTLRLKDAKLIKKGPQQIIDEGSDLAYFRQLRTELKG